MWSPCLDSPIEPKVDMPDDDEEFQEGGNMLGPSTAPAAAAAQLSAPTPSKVKVRKLEDRTKMMEYPNSLPYECESIEEFDERLAYIHQRLIECIKTKDYDIGLVQWNHKLQCLISLKYPILRATRATLASLYYEMVFIPGLDVRLIELCANMAITLLEPRRKISIKDLTLPWRPLYDLLSHHLFPKARATGLTGLSNTLMDLAGIAQRFFPPSDADDMLEEMLPQLDGYAINSILATQAYLVHFLPLSKPQRWLPAMFKLWDCFESGLFDDQMLDLLARLAILHANPEISQSEDSGTVSPQRGLWKEVGLLTKEQFAMIMTKALRSAGLPVGATKDANSALMAQSAIMMKTGSDAEVSQTILSMKKPSSRIQSFATIIVYSMMLDGPEIPSSGEATPVNAAAGPGLAGTPATTTNEQMNFLAGSRALDALHRFIQATETYFHPSNWGPWQYVLSGFVAELSSFFVNRWLDEHRNDCKTPKERRLTPTMKREFVQSLRNVCLLTMFSKDMFAVVSCQKALKRMAYLEPDLILPAVLERAYPGLQELEMTHRTTAIIASLSTLAIPLVSRQNFAAGGKHLVPLLQLCLPAIDPTDFAKTMGGCAFIFNAMMTVRIDDLTRPELGNDDGDAEMAVDDDAAAARREEDEALRLSTAGAEEWVIEFFRRIFAVFDSLPEEGVKGKVGGKQEEHVSGSLLSSVDAVTASMSPHLARLAWDVVYRHCSETVSASSSRLVGSVILSFARIHPEMVLGKMIPLATQRLRSEIMHGASSTRTTSTHTPAPGDATFHWHLSCLLGAVSGVGPALLKHRIELLELLSLLVDRTRSERGYSLVARLVQRVIATLVGLYPIEWRPYNAEEWDDPEVQKKAHMHWGKLYEAKDVSLKWHQPSQEEIAFALEIVSTFVQPSLEELNSLQDVPQERRDKVWSNDFCRKMMLVKQTFSALNAVVQDDEVNAPSGEVVSDAGDECMAFIQPPPRFKSGFILTDETSPDFVAVRSFRARVGEVLHRCATSSKASEAEDKQDCIKLLLRSIRTYLTEYAYNYEEYMAHSRSLNYYRTVFRIYARQKQQPRVLWVRRAAFYHGCRGRMNSFHRKRTPLVDSLIKDVVLAYCMSTYVGIRKTAQNSLDSIASLYDGARQLCVHTLISKVQPGVDDDQMKGALYVLGSKGFSSAAITDARITAEYLLCLLNAQHHPKPSLQKLVRGLLSDFASRFVEPSTLKFHLDTPAPLIKAVDEFTTSLPPIDASILQEVRDRRQARIARIDSTVARLGPEIMSIATNHATHWSFTLYSARLLRAMIRRDQPLAPDVAGYFAGQLLSENPNMRKYATGAITKILYFVKLRTLKASDEDLVNGKTTNPLKRKEVVQTPASAEYQKEALGAFLGSNMGPDSVLVDKTSLGWLVWGGKQTVYDAPPVDTEPWQWEAASQPALDAIWSHMQKAEFWEKHLGLWSQEKQREITATENVLLMKSIAQVFGARLIPVLGPIIEKLIGERDRHKHRAAAEVMVGVGRGSKHWPLNDQAKLWEWLTPLMPNIFTQATQDSQLVFEDWIVSTIDGRDPRRHKPLIDFAIDRAKRSINGEEDGSPQLQARGHAFFRCVLSTHDRKMTPRMQEFIDDYAGAFDTAYSEIRAVVSENLAQLELFEVAPSYASMSHFLAGEASSSTLRISSPQYERRFAKLRTDLAQWRTERIPTSQGSSRYDCAAMTTLFWMSMALADHRRSSMGSYAIDFLPMIFEMLELKDNTDLSRLARAALTKISTHHYGPGPLSGKLVRTLLNVITQSRDSWKVRLDGLTVLQVAFFQNLYYLGPADVRSIVDVLLALLRDVHPEVREMASTTLSGIVRCSERKLISDLKKRFTATVLEASAALMPLSRGDPGFHEHLTALHSGILGAVALLSAFPYEVPPWMPSLLIETVTQHGESPQPVSNTVKKYAKEFKRTHQDNWGEVEAALNSDELNEVNQWVLGRSDYYA
ncbi:hypothetical protein BDZ90DRAFT_250757 [Jaminaea rosea]|uniref:ARM repeat-containing protein n=1 Tax=Jaminaea rosea TaxID=1569628 RepID=A0A316USN9_9BASI|nr:hypothetical protein BDZ90DRAFT_250757 [Jaminaea rosea]PWN28316.1 hypothetical protein BDZ90DRAFT_250757 [Jaminaea rosea]